HTLIAFARATHLSSRTNVSPGEAAAASLHPELRSEMRIQNKRPNHTHLPRPFRAGAGGRAAIWHSAAAAALIALALTLAAPNARASGIGGGSSGGSGCTLANPTAALGLAAINGAATTCMR